MANVIYAGYGTRVNIFDSVVIASSVSINFSESQLTSESAYGALATDIRSPHFRYLFESNINIDFYLNDAVIDSVINAILNRKDKISFYLNVNGGTISINDCYWNSIAINCSREDLVTCSMSLWTLSKNVGKEVNSYDGAGAGSPLSVDDVNPIPYWSTSATHVCNSLGVLSWGFEFTQEVNKKYNISDHGNDDPYAVVLGHFSASGQVEVLQGTNFDRFNNITYNFGNKSVRFSDLVITSLDPVMESSSPYSVQISFDAFNYGI